KPRLRSGARLRAGGTDAPPPGAPAGARYRRRGPACKPNSVRRAGRRRAERGVIVIYLGPPSPTASSGLPARSGGPPFTPAEAGEPALFGLAPREVCLAAPVTGDAGGLLPHPFTHHL